MVVTCKFGSLEVYTLCVTLISLEVWKLHIVWYDDMFGSSEVYSMCVMMISLEVWKFGTLRILCDGDKF